MYRKSPAQIKFCRKNQFKLRKVFRHSQKNILKYSYIRDE